MRHNWNMAYAHILDVEGGWFNHPRDPGGATNLGITQKTYSRWWGRETTQEELKALTPEGAEPIYREYYAQPVWFDIQPGGADIMLFDMAVHAGWPRAIRMAQHVAKSKVDGILGPNTMSAIRHMSPVDFIEQFHARKMKFYRRLGTWDVFGRGFTNRANKAKRVALDAIDDCVVESGV